jgi:cytochrome c peroxidase
LHDVGTLGPGSGKRLGQTLTGIDTPTLHSLWSSAPYLHDGSAPTLRDVLRTRNPTDQHGKTSQLSDDQIDDLVQYLLSLDGRTD